MLTILSIEVCFMAFQSNTKMRDFLSSLCVFLFRNSVNRTHPKSTPQRSGDLIIDCPFLLGQLFDSSFVFFVFFFSSSCSRFIPFCSYCFGECLGDLSDLERSTQGAQRNPHQVPYLKPGLM